MLILYGRLLAENVITDIEMRLLSRGVETSSIRRASKYGVMDVVRDGDGGIYPDVIVLTDNEMQSGPYTAEEFVYMRYSRDIKIMPILSSDKRGTAYMRILLENGIYNALFLRDTNVINMSQLMLRGRSYNIPKDYYLL